MLQETNWISAIFEFFQKFWLSCIKSAVFSKVFQPFWNQGLSLWEKILHVVGSTPLESWYSEVISKVETNRIITNELGLWHDCKPENFHQVYNKLLSLMQGICRPVHRVSKLFLLIFIPRCWGGWFLLQCFHFVFKMLQEALMLKLMFDSVTLKVWNVLVVCERHEYVRFHCSQTN